MEQLIEAEELLRGQAQVWQLMFAFADSMALKCAVELRIANIIHSHSTPITLSQIASSIDSPSHPDIPYLTRIMRLLLRRKIFTADRPSDGGGTLYGPTHVSRWLVHDSDRTLAPMLLMENHPLTTNPWHCFSQCVKEGGIAFKRANGSEIWEFASQNPEFNSMFNSGMACTARVVIRAILVGYKNGFGCVGSLVDVGGGTGDLVSEIVKSHPHIKGINFDLPHVVATAPEKAIPEKTGKVIIVDVVLKPEGDDLFDDTGLVFDLLMIAHSSGGKERTELEWKKLLEEGGFPRYNIIKIPALTSIIEAYPQLQN
ncbi:hypothetical protein GH714_043539 [Hevea brasiliensis]|uniref:O-methyltransferase domain-containing protein n=1 Tax=Hevea brasiliensis TaxID=3981 RepID=A0A6A6K3I3_HEVBR|nr:hypothetical protein GH714_043539 [Hevea brasiliensis]